MDYFYSTNYDYEGKFIDIIAYPSEIADIYIDEVEFAEYLAFESFADEIQQVTKLKDP